MFAKKRYAEKAQMKKTLAMHEESSSRRKVDDDVQEGIFLDRETTTRAKFLSNTVKQKRKEKERRKQENGMFKRMSSANMIWYFFGFKVFCMLFFNCSKFQPRKTVRLLLTPNWSMYIMWTY